VVLAGVSVEGTVPGVSVTATVVGGEEGVCVEEATVGVMGAGVGVEVFTPLQAVTASTSKSMNRFIYL
jgi:hypothetical protein